MKKWLLLSTIINISILFLPNYNRFEENSKNSIISLKNVNLTSSKSTKNRENVIKEKKLKPKRIKNSLTNQKKSEKTQNVDLKIENDNSISENKVVEEKNTDISTDPVKTENKDTIVNEDGALVEESFPKEEAPISSNESDNLDEQVQVDNNIIGENFVKDNGELVYELLEAPIPKYPIKAQFFGYDKSIEIEATFIVDRNGFVKEITLNSKNEDYKKYNFDKSVYKVLSKYKFTPILYKGKNVEVRFIKNFEFKR